MDDKERRALATRQCGHPGCAKPAQHGTEPPLCSVHAHQAPQVVIPAVEGAQLYSSGYREDELALIAALSEKALSLEDEIWLLRMINRRLFAQAEGADFNKLLRLADAIGVGTARVARLSLDRKALLDVSDSTLAAALSQALDELAQELEAEGV
jgi:hypothetical protein